MMENLNELFLAESADDEGNARCVHAATGGRFLFCDAYGWLRYTDTHWTTSEAEAKLDRAIVATLKQRRVAAVNGGREAIVKVASGSTRRVRDCKALFRSIVSVSVGEFDACPDVLNVKNGVVNLRTGELTPHAPAQRFTYCSPVEYDPEADDSLWCGFLADSIGGGLNVLGYLQMAVGYSLTGRTSEECLWYVYGPARSGKGTFTETLLAVLPHPLGIEVDFGSFTASRDGDTQNFDLAPLKPARLVVASESSKYQTLNTAKIKTITGGNYVRAAYKFRDLFEYRPQFKVWLVSNEPVNADVDDDALWYRVKVIEFPNGHMGDEDKTLKQRMKAPENLRGVLRWVIEGAMAWYASPRGLVHPTHVTTSTQRHREELDHVGAWLDECTKRLPGAWTAYGPLYSSYESWCKTNGVAPKSLRLFTRALKKKGFEVREARKSEGKTFRGVKELGLLT